MQLVQSSYNVQNGLTYERYQQYFGVAQVLGGQVTLYIDDSGTIATVIGAHYPDIAPANFARLSGANARAVVDRDIGAGGNRNVDLLINPETGRYFHRIETQRPYSRWFHWIDADNGRVLNKYDAIETTHGISVGEGIGVKDDTKDMAGLTTDHSQDRRPRDRGWWLQSPLNRQLTYDAGNKGGVANIMIDSDNIWDEPGRNSPGQPAGVDAHFYAKVVYDYYWNIHDLDSFNGAGASMVSIVHAIEDNLSDAFWNGQQVVYGDGDGIDIRELSGALDVVGHEWTHAVIQYTSNLIYQDESGALSESFSDQMGTSIEFWAHDPAGDGNEAGYTDDNLDPTVDPDWLIGEDVWNWDPTEFTDPPGLRSMADPAEYGDRDHYSERYRGTDDNGGVHTNSGIPNHAYYLLVNGGTNAGCPDHDHLNFTHTADCTVKVDAIDLEDAEQIFFMAFQTLTSNATMCDAREATETVASSPPFGDPQLVSTTAAWVAVGLTDTVCGLAGEDTTPPAVPTGLMATNAGNGNVSLDWGDNDESDLAGYNVYRSTTIGESYTKINTSLVTSSNYADSGLTNGSTYYYVVRAVDTSDNESGNSNEDSAIPQASGGASVSHIVIWVEQKGPNYQAIAEVHSVQDTLIKGEFFFGTELLNPASGTVGEEGFVRLQSKKVRASGEFTITITNATSDVVTCSVSVGEKTCLPPLD